MTGRRLIVEADGGSRGNPGPAAYGAVVRDAQTGEVLAETAEAIGVATNNVAEYRGLLAGLRAARGVDPDAVVEARLDSKLVVEQLSGRWQIRNAELRPLADEAGHVFPPGRVAYVWVPRMRNAHADRLVNDALDGRPLPAPADVTSPVVKLTAWTPELGPPTTLHVVRHGQTELTAARRFSGGGLPGPSLDEAGREQAVRAAELLSTSGAVALVCSPLVRTRETAEIIGRRLGLTPVVAPGWRECHFGDWDGLTLAEIAERDPEALTRWYGSSSLRPPGGGESLDDLTPRVVAARDELLAAHPGQPVVVVTHSIPLRTLTRLALGAPMESLFRLLPSPGSVTELQYYADGSTAMPSFGHRP
ncbi:bifunctional RNase H/acid phosphatase [Jiangella anatolica]|uniref:Bifunctional RNase H/acid phosphatase n=1 Tax=Jiangella anatolica TaxID=2670374 RepID=A0A2W2B9Q8_9ACTN|nr:bifunctional RNase H/acid phosphatase [Jiangella anatolica]PZF81910.1 bifunctional RNase H/acid phosphatase [Jiangella anatolica]